MTPLEILALVVALAFLAALISFANDIRNTEDGDDYNNESGLQEDFSASGKQDAHPHGQGTTGAGAGSPEGSRRDT